MKNFELKAIAISNLVAHPDNPNAMSDSMFKKLLRNIERTELYEPIVVRPHPQKKGIFQIINGHHRVKALEKLGRKEANCVVWEVNDQETAVLLATLNRLAGSDIPAKKSELLKQLKERFDLVDLAKILPATTKQIERLTNLKLNPFPAKPDSESFAIPLVFFVTKQQQEIIEKALSGIEHQASRNEMTKPQRRAAAITKIASRFMEVEKCRA